MIAKPDRIDDTEKKNTSLRLQRKTLRALKMHALENDTSVQRIIEDLVESYLKRQGKRQV